MLLKLNNQVYSPKCYKIEIYYIFWDAHISHQKKNDFVKSFHKFSMTQKYVNF